tara:strand:- start:2597 stop:2728 length:132 start_codon:yes stop_codon:yes gene_type:complete
MDVFDDFADGYSEGVLVGVIDTHVNRYHSHWTISVVYADDLLI